MGKRGSKPGVNTRLTRPKCTVQSMQDVEREQEVEEIFAAQRSPVTEAKDKSTRTTSSSEATAGSHRDAQAPSSVAVSEGTPSTQVQSVMRGVQPREVCIEVNYALLAQDAPGPSEEKAAARAAEVERVGKEVGRLYSQARKCDDALKAQGIEGKTEENTMFRALCKAVHDGRFDVRSALGPVLWARAPRKEGP